MIKANELRIGNLILDDLDSVATVCELTAQSVNAKKDGINWGTCFRPKGIPLTAEWLLKFNLRQGHDWLLNTPNGLCSIPCGEDSLLFDLDSGLHFEKEICDGCFDLSLTKIKYVHQLQNLYFALTGEELKLK